MADSNYIYINNTGTILPDSSIILGEVEQEYRDVFGENLITTPNTPQGILITSEALARIETLTNNCVLANQINPDIAGGVFLRALCALTGLQIDPDTSTLVIASLTGVAGTVIGVGSSASISDGTIFNLIDPVTLDSMGNGTGEFQCTIPGPIEVPVNSLTHIVSGVPGWETVSNSDIQVSLGSFTPTDAEIRLLRTNTLALQGSGLPEAVKSALRVVPGVLSSSFWENTTDFSIVKDGVTLLPHSIYNCVDGGTDLAVATAILTKKGGGCNYNGDITQPVFNETSGQTYPVKFSRPDLIPILIQVTAKTNPIVTNAEQIIINTILAYANGQLNGQPGFVVNGDVSPFELGWAIGQANPQIFVTLVEITTSSSFSTSTIPILIHQKAITSAGSITVFFV